MPIVDVKGVGKAKFPDDMDINDIRNFLRNKYSQQAAMGQSDILAPVENIAAPYSPTLVEKIGGGIADTLKSTGLISDNYGAQRIGRNIASIGEFLPGVGDAAAGDDFGRNLKAGNYGSTALDAVGIIPVLGDMAIFAGALAKNADLGALRKAKMLEDTGADRNKIWADTGWVNDKGDWKFEIDDSKSVYDRYFLGGKDVSGFGDSMRAKELVDTTKGEVRILKDAGTYNVRDFWDNKPDGAYDEYHKARKTIADFAAKVNPKRTVTDLSNVLQHDELNKNYDFSGAQATLDPSGAGGSYYKLGDTDKIEIKSAMTGEYADNTGPKSTAMHELQHAVQEREGFAKGGSTDIFKKDYTTAETLLPSYKLNVKNIEEYIKNTDEYKVADKKMKDAANNKNIPLMLEAQTDKNKIMNDPVYGLEGHKKKLYDAYGTLKNNPHESYMRLGGEAEARNVQTRMSMTPDERRAKPPWETLDVPEDELIYRK